MEACIVGRREDIPEELSAGDLFALPSYVDAAPITLLEAMCAGLPVVTASIDSVCDPLLDGYSGYLR